MVIVGLLDVVKNLGVVVGQAVEVAVRRVARVDWVLVV